MASNLNKFFFCARTMIFIKMTMIFYSFFLYICRYVDFIIDKKYAILWEAKQNNWNRSMSILIEFQKILLDLMR